MARVRKCMHAYVVPYHTKSQNGEFYKKVENKTDKVYNQFFDFFVNKSGKIICLERPISVRSNEQILHQVVDLQQLDDYSCSVIIQASVISHLYNLDTVNSKFTCAESHCCTQLFTRYLYKTRLRFIFAKLLDKTPQKIHVVGHSHAPNGVIHILFELVEHEI